MFILVPTPAEFPAETPVDGRNAIITTTTTTKITTTTTKTTTTSTYAATILTPENAKLELPIPIIYSAETAQQNSTVPTTPENVNGAELIYESCATTFESEKKLETDIILVIDQERVANYIT